MITIEERVRGQAQHLSNLGHNVNMGPSLKWISASMSPNVGVQEPTIGAPGTGGGTDPGACGGPTCDRGQDRRQRLCPINLGLRDAQKVESVDRELGVNARLHPRVKLVSDLA